VYSEHTYFGFVIFYKLKID